MSKSVLFYGLYKRKLCPFPLTLWVEECVSKITIHGHGSIYCLCPQRPDDSEN